MELKCIFSESSQTEYEAAIKNDKSWHFYLAKHSGYLQGSREENLVRIADKLNCCIRLLHPFGSYVLEGTPLWATDTEYSIPEEEVTKVNLQLDIFPGQSIQKNPFYGLQHLVEVAIKALSPAINDPGTAVLSLHALDDLLAFLMKNFMKQILLDGNGKVAVILPAPAFNELFERSILPIWDYGKNDRFINAALITFLEQLTWLKPNTEQAVVMRHLRSLIKGQLEQNTSSDPEKQLQLQRLQHLSL